jgi:hypothetical protein
MPDQESWENDDPATGRLLGASCRYTPVTFAGSEDQRGKLVEVIAGEVMWGSHPSDPAGQERLTPAKLVTGGLAPPGE